LDVCNQAKLSTHLYLPKKHYWLYVLKLEQGKYYVGVTSKTPEIRMKEHTNGFGAAWTRKYKPLKLLDKKGLGLITYEEAEKYENKVVRKYMNERGFNNVRGGDLRSPDNFVKRFGWYFDKASWETLTLIIFILLVFVVLALKRYLH